MAVVAFPGARWQRESPIGYASWMRISCFLVLVMACGGSDAEPCVFSSDCEVGMSCVNMACTMGAEPDGGGPPDARVQTDASMDTSTDTGPVDAPDATLGDGGVDVIQSDGGPEEDVPLGLGCSSFPDLFIDEGCTRTGPGVFVTEPSHPLWSDALVKTRYIRLPDGSQIDSSNSDGWVFPVGTLAWKTFATAEGQRLETRRMEKTGSGAGPGEWDMRTFVWNAADTMATEVGAEGMENVLGTDHDIPSRLQCVTCHSNGTPDVLLGISAILLNHPDSPLSLEDMNAMNMLTDVISESAAVFPGNAVERNALGYLHTNCGSCHGGPSPTVGMGLRVDVADENVSDTAAFAAIGSPSFWMSSLQRIRPGNREGSAIYVRASIRGDSGQMPPLGTEVVDNAGLDAVGAWIDSLRVEAPRDTVFYPVVANDGNLFGRPGADTFCQDRLPPLLNGRVAHAFLCIGSTPINTHNFQFEFDGSRTLVTLDGTELAPNWQAVVDRNFTNPFSTTGLMDDFYYATGCGCAGNACGSFTSARSGVVTCVGDVRYTDERAISAGLGTTVTSCDEPFEFLCYVEPI